MDNTVTIGLAGQPNVGKSTVFNILTGLNQHVGNWPGKTVEQRTGSFEHDGIRVDVVDLPGTYCLTAASPEEVIARDYVIHQQPDVIIVILNAAALERNLYLVAELLALPVPLVIGLNMMDVAEQEGFEIESGVLAEAIGVPVVSMVARRGQGVHDLVDVALQVAQHGAHREPSRAEIQDDHLPVLERLQGIISGYVPSPYPPHWVSLKLLEGDQQITELARGFLPPERWAELETLLRQHEDALIAVATGRYEWIRRMTRAALKRPKAGRITFTHRLDRIATHPFWGLLVLATVLAIIFGLTYSLGSPLQQWMTTHLIGSAGEWATRSLATAPRWLASLVVQGIIGGFGTMVTFTPILMIFFAVMALLEDVGYMARAAYVVDRFMHLLGLHGKSFVPLFLGFGCNVPAIMGARIIDSRRAQLLTIMLAPLVPCAARLGVLAFLVPVFFPQQATLVSWALTALPILVLGLVGAVVGRFFTRSESTAFIMEMPLYHIPSWRTIGLLVWQRIIAFLHKAGTVILLVSILVWLLASLPHGEIETSYLAGVGRLLAPVGAWMGLDWQALVALLTSFVAKENSVATLGVLYGAGEDMAALFRVLGERFSPASALAFLVAQMLFIPCVSTLATIRQETASWRWTLATVASLAVLTLVGGVVTYQVARLLF